MRKPPLHLLQIKTPVVNSFQLDTGTVAGIPLRVRSSATLPVYQTATNADLASPSHVFPCTALEHRAAANATAELRKPANNRSAQASAG